ncbi:CHAP domain-containing protein [Paraburkholderia sp. 22099]|mgnify:CR=1 FL=1|jgi:hypothetical protein|uniref:Peptidase C51 domain-containing protein n=1 Tax=Paraburkholderia terricola TaxID=169427 RepID=A0ABU1LQV4_9BURK|nr:CHAP domain-containing protein [Paraburkholderia terricola]MDR6409120.1 hypothetical protein [Paraburkholderia terricola]MDR6448560.1 hypothetical protein [Paraburkholderia terricola]MDR6482616.1 hypothetical protein [Paraburkholderia terricola]MDR6494365.1 hypothetical protein [Paraburkholderia terricola]
MSYTAFPALSFPTQGLLGTSYPSGSFGKPLNLRDAFSNLPAGNWNAAGNSGGMGDPQMEQLFLQFLLALTSASSPTDSYSPPQMPSGGGITQASYRGSNGSSGGSSGSEGAVQRGDANVAPAGNGNAAGVAQTQLHKSAASIMQNQGVPMEKGVDTTVCCANFVSACLVKAGDIPQSQHTNLVSTLDSELKRDGWHNVSRSEAKPGDVCIVGADEHVEIVASNDHGKITLIGSNNTQGGSGPQVVSYDTYTGNTGNVKFLSD